MAVPKRKISRSRKGSRASHYALDEPNRSVCPRCGASKSPHRICPSCGYYRDKQFVVPKE